MVYIQTFLQNTKTAAESACNALPNGQWVAGGMPQPEAFGPEDAEIVKVYNHVLAELGGRGTSFVKEFAAIIGDDDDDHADEIYDTLRNKGIDLYKALDPLSNGRTILHLLIKLVSEHSMDQDAACDLTRTIVHDEPKLIKERVDDYSSNALELAASSENCLGIIKAICEHGMVSEDKDKTEADLGEQGLRPASVPAQQLIPRGEANLQPNILPDSAMPPGESSVKSAASNGRVGQQRTIKKDGKIITVRVAWLDLTQDGADTCLHIAIKSKKNDYASYLVSRMRYTDEHKHILQHKGQSGLTPLHVAVNAKQCSSERVELVKDIMDLCPAALAMESGALSRNPGQVAKDDGGVRKENLAPYKYFVESKATVPKDRSVVELSGRKPTRRGQRAQAKAQVDAQSSKEINDQSAIGGMDKLLRLGCMRYYGRNRELITKLLGKPNQIHLDLNPREEVTQQFFDYMATIRFEPYLQYVYIPNLRVLDVKNEDPKVEREKWWRSKSRKDYFYIFCWLEKSRGVKRILSLVVEDGPINYHGDEVIEESVKEFDIEEWDWVKPDMCSDTILAAAKNVRDLTLHWSGNRAVLRSWAAPDGLASLEKLEIIKIKTQESIESATRFAELRTNFLASLTHSWEQKWEGKPPRVKFETVPAKKQTAKKLSEREKEEKSLKQQWFSCMDEFGQTLTTYLNNRKDRNERQGSLNSDEVVKVAIIDDGVYPDRDSIGDHIAEGETFYDSEGHWPGHYQSTYGHGHLMACLIRYLCPRVRLYIAKLNELWRDGRSQITTESAAEAIHWATGKGVDIISMSWTIETPEEDAKGKLKTAIDEALGQDILLFCASDDQGNLNKIPYPACIDTRIFWIGSATALGKPNNETQQGVMFIAPGTEEAQEAPHGENLSSTKPRVGSSIATARCAGLAALILQCILLAPDGYERSQVRKEGNMRKMFTRMTGDQNGQCKYLRIWEVFKEARKKAGIDDELNIISHVASTFLKDVEEISARKSSQLLGHPNVDAISPGPPDLRQDAAAPDISQNALGDGQVRGS